MSQSSSPPSPPLDPPFTSTNPYSSSSSLSSPPIPCSDRAMLLGGLLSGVLVAGLFNPWDRALYLSVLHSRPFLHIDNFKNPYRGFYQSLFHRTLSSGIYFPLFDIFQPIISKQIGVSVKNKEDKSLLIHFVSGNLAGAVSGIVLNQLTAIKYASWDNNHSFVQTAKGMWRSGGMNPFLKGIVPTVMRDTIFGGTFALVKYITGKYIKNNKPANVGNKSADFIASLIAGGCGTIASSPFNYVRNIKYGWNPSQSPPSSFNILLDLIKDAKNNPHPFSFIQDRLRIGWGTGRVAVGMAVGYEIYDVVKRRVDRYEVKNERRKQEQIEQKEREERERERQEKSKEQAIALEEECRNIPPHTHNQR